MDLGQWIAIGLSALMGLWFGVGTFYNRRRGIDTYRWLQSGLQSLGKVSEASWIGSSASGARLVVGGAASPFRRVEVIFLLESREILPLWVFNRIRNKQDEMILKAALRSVPAQEIEVFRRRDRQAQTLLAQSGNRGHQPETIGGGYQMIPGLEHDSKLANGIAAFLDKYPRAIRRISFQRKTPHLMLRVDLPPLRDQAAESFFRSMQDMLKP